MPYNKQSLNRTYKKTTYAQNNPNVTRRNTSNTGSAFENLIIYANNLYNLKNMAFVQKLEQPVLIKKKFPDGRVEGKLKKSTVDFLGATNAGKMIAFDAKSNSNSTSFPLGNIEEHQYEILKKYHDMNALSFLLVEWTPTKEFFLLPFAILEEYWEGAKNGERKSIPYQVFVDRCTIVESGERGIPIDYLAPFGVS